MKDLLDELNRVIGLIDRAEALLDWSQDLSGLFELGLSKTSNKQQYLTSGPMMLLVIQVNLFFQDAILCINTVLFGDTSENEEEIGLPYIIQKYGERIYKTNPAFKNRFDEAKKLYENSQLKIIRNKLIAHKDLMKSGDAIAGFMHRYNNIVMNNLKEVILILRGSVAGFNVPRDNGFKDFYMPAFKILKSTVEPKTSNNS